MAAHRVVAAAIAQSRKVFMNPRQRQPIPARLLLVGLQLALEFLHPRPKLRHRLDLARVAVRGLIAPHHLAHRVHQIFETLKSRAIFLIGTPLTR